VGSDGPRVGPGRGLVIAVILLAGGFMLAAGAWALFAAGSFADAAEFPRHTHFVHDAGAFQLGIGATLLLALAWRDRLALAGLLVANSVHTVNHAVDLRLGGHSWDPWGLATLTLLAAAALVVRLRQLGWVVGEVGIAAGAVALPGAKAWRSRDLRLGSDRYGQLVERGGQPPIRRLLSGELVVPRRTFWTKA
jgi:hypothetical protein